MPVLHPTSIAHAVAALDADPGATVLAGGTDLMVEINSGRRTPTRVVSIGRVDELRQAAYDPKTRRVRFGAAMTFSEIIRSVEAARVPALVEALQCVGAPQIRNAATLGGNLATGSPAGDPLPVLVALDASVELVSRRGPRVVSAADFLLGAEHAVRRPAELIAAVLVPTPQGGQHFARTGPRQAMTVATASAAIAVDRRARSVRLALGAVAPTVVLAPEAGAWLAGHIDWATTRLIDPVLAEATTQRFGELAREACRPVDDHRSTADYRRHAAGILAARLARRALT